jgi:hypothetical protein
MYLDEKILLKWILKDCEGRYWNKLGPNGRVQVPCEHGNKYTRSIKGEELLTNYKQE